MAISLVDTHAHIHFDYYEADPDEVLKSARLQGVEQVICVGCSIKDSEYGLKFAGSRDNVWTTIGVHPHEAKDFVADPESHETFEALLQAGSKKLVAIGECGLDYFYENSPKEAQVKLLKFQLEMAQKYELPVMFHVRAAFADFWPIFDQYKGLKGVVHSFTGTEAEMEQVLSRGLYIGLNGIMTFTKDQKQLETVKKIPLERIVVETDAPYLTPNPFRGKVCKPEHVRVTAEFLADLRGETLGHFAQQTTINACTLFGLIEQEI